MAAPSGIPFGNYQLIKRIARGGMAEVFLGRQKGPEGFDRLVAVKRILPHLVESPDFVQMFFDEARLAANLSHPNCVHIYEFGKVEEHHFIAMEYVEGVDAGDLIRWAGAREPLPPVLVARIGADACAGLHYAHELRDVSGRVLQLVHRDVSPPNLLVSYDGTVKLVDFGIAKAAICVEQTRPGVVKGKYAYMSPEQTTGRPLDGKSDVFSLALVLWEMLAGQVAVTRGDQVAAMETIRDGKIRPLEKVRPDVPRQLAQTLARGLAVDPEERVSALELGLGLEEFIKSSSDLGSPLQLAQWVRQRFPRRSPTGELEALDDGPPGTRQATPASLASGVMSGAPGDEVPPLPGGPSVQVEGLDADEGETTEISTEPPAPADDLLSAYPRAIGFRRAGEEAERAPPPPGPGAESLTQMAATVPHGSAAKSEGRARRIAIAAGASLLVGLAALLLIPTGGSSEGAAGARAGAPDSGEAEAPAPEEGRPAGEGAAGDPAIDAGGLAAPAADAAAGFGTLEILTRPSGAIVRLDEGAPTETPVRFAEVEPGEHDITLELEGHEPLRRTLRVAAGERRTLELRLAEKAEEPDEEKRAKEKRAKEQRPRRRPNQPGRLTVRTRPWSAVYHRGRKLGTTPFANVKLKPGRYVLTFKNPERGTTRRRVTIRPGRTTKLDFELGSSSTPPRR